jgi:putative addiction module antidote
MKARTPESATRVWKRYSPSMAVNKEQQCAMNKPLVIRKVGNSLTVTVSELVKELGLGEGDKLCAIRTPRGFEITPFDANFNKAVEAAQGFMRKYPNAMKKLAE